MFPNTTAAHLASLPEPPTINVESPIFSSERSRSLWKQLITPPPLQPPNWTKSRIRRLFLVSLGVPVDLDEILPPSKQKKLVLPDINLEPTSGRKSESDKTTTTTLGAVERLKAKSGAPANESTASVDSAQSQTRSQRGGGPGTGGRPSTSNKHRRHGSSTTAAAATKGPGGGGGRASSPGPPDLDLVAVKRLCATTEEKLDGLTDDELKAHVAELNAYTGRTSELLQYWLKRRDGARKEKEAFEGVIENLVRHARRVRK